MVRAPGSTALQQTSKAVQMLISRDQREDTGIQKRQRPLAVMLRLPELDTFIEDESLQDGHLMAMPGDDAEWRQQNVDWECQHCGTKNTQKVHKGRVRELANWKRWRLTNPSH